MSLQPMNSPDETQLRIAFDLDVVLYADENKEDSEYALQNAASEVLIIDRFYIRHIVSEAVAEVWWCWQHQ